ncbi:hypothetical protein J6590_102762 [Homalodisca vitripennis]|nr:hypothetical protein J6590_102762 [Homalodisca vitripennis]
MDPCWALDLRVEVVFLPALPEVLSGARHLTEWLGNFTAASQRPPKFGAQGGLKFQWISFLAKWSEISGVEFLSSE